MVNISHPGPQGEFILANPDGIRWLRVMRSDSDGRSRRKAQLMLESCTMAYLGAITSTVDLQLDEALNEQTIDGVSLKEIPTVIVNESDQRTRAALDLKYELTIAGLNDLRWDRIKSLEKAAIDIGYPDFPTMVWDIWELDGRSILKECDLILKVFHQRYLKRVARFLYRAGCNEPEQTQLRDWHNAIYRILTTLAPEWSYYHISEIALRTVRSFGLPQPKTLYIKFVGPDQGGRGFSTWQAGSSEATIVIPSDYIAVSLPLVLHEVGHAAEGCSRDPSIDPEFAVLVDLAVSEAWAFMVEAACHDPVWLFNAGATNAAKDLAEVYSLFAAYKVRKYAAMIPYIVALFKRGPSAQQEYASRMFKATGFFHNPSLALADVDELWRAVGYIRGYALAFLALEKMARLEKALDLRVAFLTGAAVAPTDFAKLLGQAEFHLRLAGYFGVCPQHHPARLFAGP